MVRARKGELEHGKDIGDIMQCEADFKASK